MIRTEAGGEAREELLAYLGTGFDLSGVQPGTRLPLADELFVDGWRAWLDTAKRDGVRAVLDRLPQLAFPVLQGISRDPDYRAATLRGADVRELAAATGLGLDPERIEVELHASPAGRIPVLIARRRREFVLLVQALIRCNEPWPVPEAQGAAMVGDYNNWSRIRALRRLWEERRAAGEDKDAAQTWAEQMRRILRRRELYQDRLIVLSDGPYSAVPAARLGLDEERWRELSLALRRDHECCHYFTRRLFGSMRNHAHDELMADYCGLVGAIGRFRADWFLTFLGIETPGHVRPEGRLHIYRGDPPLSDAAFALLQQVLRAAAEQLETFDRARPLPGDPRSLGLRLTALAALPLDQLAAPEGLSKLADAEDAAAALFGG